MTQLSRRTIVTSAAALSLAGLIGAPAVARPQAKAPTPGKPGDFDFLTGDWKIANKWRNKTTDSWLEFPGEATVRGILKGVVSVEELRIPARDFSGMGLRTLDLEKKVWTDYWVNGKAGVMGRDGVTGSFENGAGIFDSPDTENGKPVIYRGIWDKIVPGVSHNWSSLISRDNGKTWEGLWLMEWTRA
ncbi:hypothetical protein FPZ24_13155 [Sphingomonas panacisoli]|uniref:DUF1579 domain-containing protein n=1 Tax=Sphingomonas panacisoli TaxID=1813879 RepID=A0A5B8LMM6_9SPHN|nr:hypothetical protein [Sphingomonas panacisoli]QDZ08310.1 hypothetical protein FPZ24_13155 [Sphingomonas panacisoli]